MDAWLDLLTYLALSAALIGGTAWICFRIRRGG
jgi:hypothetical protein